mgnify:CR=1 FL=1
MYEKTKTMKGYFVYRIAQKKNMDIDKEINFCIRIEIIIASSLGRYV